MFISASYLYDKNSSNHGKNKCFFCGMGCDEQYKREDYVKKTFTNYDVVICPGSNYVCGCCVSSMIGIDTTTLVDGDLKEGRGGAPRMYSWVLTEKENYAFSKRHFSFAREIIIDPPEPPFSIVLADGIQKQLIFRAVVNNNRDVFDVMMDEKKIQVIPSVFKEYLDIATLCSAAIGKKALTSPDCFNSYRQIIEKYGDEKNLIPWLKIYSSPMGILASWLSPGRKGTSNENVIRTRIPTKINRNNGQNDEKRGARKKRENNGDQVLLDLA